MDDLASEDPPPFLALPWLLAFRVITFLASFLIYFDWSRTFPALTVRCCLALTALLEISTVLPEPIRPTMGLTVFFSILLDLTSSSWEESDWVEAGFAAICLIDFVDLTDLTPTVDLYPTVFSEAAFEP